MMSSENETPETSDVEQSNQLKTPVLSHESVLVSGVVISPTQPLKFKRSTDELKNNLETAETAGTGQFSKSLKEFKSQNSLHSQFSSLTSTTNASYITAMDNMGLGIDKLDDNQSSSTLEQEKKELTINPSASTESTDKEYYDEKTPQMNNFVFEDDKTPKVIRDVKDIPPPQAFNSTQSQKVAGSNIVNLNKLRINNNVSNDDDEISASNEEESDEDDQYGNTENRDIDDKNVSGLKERSEKRILRDSSMRPLKKPETGALNTSFNYSFNDTTYSQESNQLNQLSKEKQTDILPPSLTNNNNLESSENNTQILSSPASPPSTQSNENDAVLTALFLTAIHSFDSNTLELHSDSAICLSFTKNDVVFVHSVDKTGWGEVTLIKNFKRGWVPINYFTEIIKPNDENKSLSKTKLPLKQLFIASAKFMRNPIDENTKLFSINYINEIRDGVRTLLEKTDCLSRSTEIVKKKPIIRRIRKSLLADWYSLMIKADSYKHNPTIDHIETLQLMVLQVLKKSIAFMEIWSIELETLKKEQNINKQVTLQQKISNQIPYLDEPPMAKARLNEIHNILFNYIGLILGRLDMIEHNPTGCQLLENLTHQIILLLREILFISKSCVIVMNKKNRSTMNSPDDNLDTLLSLVSELVSSLKHFVTKTINEDYSKGSLKIKDELYYYTPEGEELIGIISRMTGAISISIDHCFKNLASIGDFQLNADKKYPDFKKIKISSSSFIKICSEGLIKSLNKKNIDLHQVKRSNIKKQARFSMIRSGTTNEISLTSSGTNLLQEFLPDSKSFIRDSVFQPYLNEHGDENGPAVNDIEYEKDIKDEIMYDSSNHLIGASFKGLVFLLTNELKKPDEFFISSFFLTFKLYSNGVELIEELISRFNLTNKFDKNDDYDEFGEYSSYESKLKNRRKLICSIFTIWLQSYWDYQVDYFLLPTLINFFNEGVSEYLPIESKKLIELCSKLTSLTPTKLSNSQSVKQFSSSVNELDIIANGKIQLVSRFPRVGNKRSSMISNSSSISSFSSSSFNNDLDDDDYIFEEYQLAKIHSNHRSSIYLSLPGLNNYNNNILLNKNETISIEDHILKYRKYLTNKRWPFKEFGYFQSIETNKLLNPWFNICNKTFQINNEIFNSDDESSINLVNFNAFEIAKQLTLIESKIFLNIRPDELLNGNFQMNKSKLSPNISKSLKFTNLLSEYVLESILSTEITFKKRIERFNSWLNVALSCYYLKNFNSLAAIIISLQNHIITRLETLIEHLPTKYFNLFEDLKKVIHPNNNYKGYRIKLNKLLEEGGDEEQGGEKCSRPVIPYINLFLQDLTFIEEGNKNYRNSNSFLRSKIINVDKFFKISRIVSNLEYLQVGYDSVNLPVNSYGNGGHLPTSPHKRRSSVFSFSSSSNNVGLNNEKISPVLSLQELILLELWRVHQLCLNDTERHWKMSKEIKS